MNKSFAPTLYSFTDPTSSTNNSSAPSPAPLGRSPNITDYLISLFFMFICVPSISLYVFVTCILCIKFSAMGSRFNVLLISLAVPDLISLTLQLFYCVPCTMLQMDITASFMNHYIWAYFSHVCWFLQIFHVAYIGANRLICMRSKSFDVYDRIFSTKFYAGSIAAIYFIACALVGALNGMTCFSSYNYEFYFWGYSCPSTTLGVVGDWLNISVSLTVCSFIVIVYVLTWWELKRKNNSIGTIGAEDKAAKKRQSIEKKLVMQFMVVAVNLTLLEISFYTIPRIPFLSGPLITVIISIFYLSFCANNPIIYLIFNMKLKQMVGEILGARVAVTQVGGAQTQFSVVQMKNFHE